MTKDQLQGFYPKFLNIEKENVEDLEKPDYNKEAILIELEDNCISLAVYEIIINKNVNEAKKYFYKASQIAIYRQKNFGSESNTSSNVFIGAHSFKWAILSDSAEMIKQFLSYKDDFLKTYSASFAKAIQAALQNDQAKLAAEIELLKEYCSKGWEKAYVGCVNAFTGILKKEKKLLEKGLIELMEKHQQQEHDAVVNGFMNLEAITLAKIAYRNGIEVSIENKLLPKEMIPTEELKNYEKYNL